MTNSEMPKGEELSAVEAEQAVEHLIKSKRQVCDHGDAFTPSWLGEDMPDIVKDESERVSSRLLEPAISSFRSEVESSPRSTSTTTEVLVAHPIPRRTACRGESCFTESDDVPTS